MIASNRRMGLLPASQGTATVATVATVATGPSELALPMFRHVVSSRVMFSPLSGLIELAEVSELAELAELAHRVAAGSSGLSTP